jgi:formylglycine-generating enzyme required for sulfatase activity
MGSPQACWDLDNTCAVGQYPATLFGQPDPDGLSDLSGNVWEWTASQYVSYPAATPCTMGTESCVFRGGSWSDDLAMNLRAAFRNVNLATDFNNLIGMRCARSPAR